MNTVNTVDIEKPAFGTTPTRTRADTSAPTAAASFPKRWSLPIEELTEGYLAARADCLSATSCRACFVTTWADRRRFTKPGVCQSRPRGGPTNIRILHKREDLTHTGRAQDQQRARSGAARRRMGKTRSSPRPARVSTALRRRPRAPCSASSAMSTWAPRTCDGRR
jgi:hypothetical protein